MITFRDLAQRMDPVRPPTRLRGSPVAWLDGTDPKSWLVTDSVVQTVSSLPNRSEVGLWHKEDKGLLQMHRWPKGNNPIAGESKLSLRAISRRHEGHPAWTFKFLWYNTWLLRTGIGLGTKPLIDVRRHEIGKVIAKGNYHIVGLCEVFDEDERQVIRDEIGKLHSFDWARGPEHSLLLSSGLMTLGIDKVGIRSRKGKAFEEEGGGLDAMARKGILYTEMELRPPNSDLRPCIDLFITHLHAEELPTRLVQLKELGEFIKAYSKPQNPTIVAGDFNIDSRSSQANSIEYVLLLDGMSSLNLFDLWLSRGSLAGGTNVSEDPGANADYAVMCEFDPTVPGDFCQAYPTSGLNNPDRVPGKRLDYVFVEQPNQAHDIMLDISRVRRSPFWRGPYSPFTLDHKHFYSHGIPDAGDDTPNFMSDHLGLEFDMLVTPMSEIS